MDKVSIVRTNEDYGVMRREMFKGNKAQSLDLNKLETISDKHIQMSLRLQAAFGLRREESIKFKPKLADQGDHIALVATWCKGRRSRTIPITTERQRALLDEAIAFAGAGSLIPSDRSYKDQLQIYKHQTLKAGLKNNHGLRHNYAQWRYKTITGREPPTLTGDSYNKLTATQKQVDKEARQIISRELGHERIEITNVYLGGRR